MMLLSDKIQYFIAWLEDNTDYSEWEPVLKMKVHMKLIEYMTMQDKEEKKVEHDWQWYMNGTFCRKCGQPIGSGLECK